jgi:hypothetical protein
MREWFSAVAAGSSPTLLPTFNVANGGLLIPPSLVKTAWDKQSTGRLSK